MRRQKLEFGPSPSPGAGFQPVLRAALPAGGDGTEHFNNALIPLEYVEEPANRQKLAGCLERLPGMCFHVLFGRYYDDMAPEEIGLATGRPAGDVRILLTISMDILMEEIGRGFEGVMPGAPLRKTRLDGHLRELFGELG